MHSESGRRTPFLSPRQQGGGFTLVEVLVMLVLVTLAVLAAARFTGDTQDGLGEVRVRDRAVQLARRQMVLESAEGFTSTTSRSGEFRDAPGYRWEARAESTQFSDIYNYRLTVQWDGGSLSIERFFRE